MSLAEMEACISRLYVDESFRKLLYLDTEATLQEYNLTEEESGAIKNIDRDRLDFFARSLKNKRKEAFDDAYPALFALDDVTIERLYQRYYELRKANPYESGLQDVLNFGMFMEESVADVGSLPVFTSDLVRYERLCHWVTSTPAAPQSSNDRDNAIREQTVVATDNMQPSVYPLVRMEVFDYNVPEIREELQRGKAAAEIEVENGETYILFRPADDVAASLVTRINIATKTLLDLCDGSRSVSQIIATVEDLFNAGNLREAMLDAINRLVELRVLIFNTVDRGGGARVRGAEESRSLSMGESY
jgi:hypothetical protein